MSIDTYTIPLTRFNLSSACPLTRASVIELARSRMRSSAGAVRLVIVSDDEDTEHRLPVELATVEVVCSHSSACTLQYVSHPAESLELTSSILLSAADLEFYIRERKRRGLDAAPKPICAQHLEREGLHPQAILNLRLDNPTPVVATFADVAYLQR